jgi:L-amino acid N-acyltransferase
MTLNKRDRALVMHAMIAGIDGKSTGSIRLHRSVGFEHAGHLREVSYEFGRWLDLIFAQEFIMPFCQAQALASVRERTSSFAKRFVR